MALTHFEFDYEPESTPSNIVDFLLHVDSLVERHRVDIAKDYRGFVPSNYETVYHCLNALFKSHVLCGNTFCEWGSGLSVVASLAALIGFDSYGIEQDAALSEAAESIRQSRDIPVKLANGSFIPAGAEDLVDRAYANNAGELALHTDSDLAYEDLGIEVSSFDLIFAYPWPNDVSLVHEIFDRFAAWGAVLMIYDDRERVLLFRKN